MSLFITSLNSGSNGNCYYIGNDREAILVDAGISCRETEKRMKRLGLSIESVKAGVLAPGGTASEVSIPGYQLAGKTGTANKVDPKTGTYSDTNYIASFVGFAPANNPKLLISVMVDQPEGGSIFGAEVAAPAFGKIASFALGYEKIPPQ